jgi:hypothetical protein
MATTGYADVIPFFGGKRTPLKSRIELVVAQLPPEMTLIFLNDKKKESLIDNQDGTSFISLHESGTIFITPKELLSIPFSLKHDMPKLIPLRKIEDSDFPGSYAAPLPPSCFCCAIQKAKDAYALNCDQIRAKHISACMSCPNVK